jgi:hypothetical protein
MTKYKRTMSRAISLFLLSCFAILLIGCTTETVDDINTALPEEDKLEIIPVITETTPIKESKKYEGTILAGTESVYLDFDEDDYQKALSEGKIIMLYFYADWSTNAMTEERAVIAAFNKLINPEIIGFRLNYDDERTTPAEAKLASDFKVSISPTKVIIKDGKVEIKSSTKWNENDYVRQLTQFLD